MSLEMLKMLTMAVIAALIFVTGWSANGWRKNAEIERIERAHADQRARDAVAAADEIAAAQKRGDTLAARVAATETTRDTALQETQHALRKVTTGKPCLSGSALRLLNGAAGLKPAVPAPAGQPAGADAAFATDTDVAEWAAHARRSYDTCRGRLDAVRDFYQEEN